MFIQTVCEALHRSKVPYAIVGGYAVALHGAVRGTIDIDIAIHWSLKNLENLEKALNEIGLISRIPIDAKNLYHFREEYITNRDLIAWNFYNPKNLMHQVDIVITYDLKNAAVKTFNTSYGKINVLSLLDLIKMKKTSGRHQDLEDVKALECL